MTTPMEELIESLQTRQAELRAREAELRAREAELGRELLRLGLEAERIAATLDALQDPKGKELPDA